MSKRDELVAALVEEYRAWDEAERAWYEAERAWREAYRALWEHDNKEGDDE